MPINLKIMALTFGVSLVATHCRAETISKTETPMFEALQQQAQEDGLVRVLVELSVQNSASDTQIHTDIDQSKLILQSALSMLDAPLAEPIEGQPFIVMEVTARGLAFLHASPLVVRIQADGLVGVPPVEASPNTEDETPSFGGNGNSGLSAPLAEN